MRTLGYVLLTIVIILLTAFAGFSIYFAVDNKATVTPILENYFGIQNEQTDAEVPDDEQPDDEQPGTDEEPGDDVEDDKTYLYDIIVDVGESDMTTFKSSTGTVFISGEASSLSGVNILNADNSVTQIYTSSGYWDTYKELSSKDILISGASTMSRTTFGILLYDYETGNVSQVYGNGYSWDEVIEKENGDAFISNSGDGVGEWTNEKGILYYTATTSEVTSIYSEGYDWAFSCELPNGNTLLSSTVSDTGIVLHDMSTGTTTQVYSEGSYFMYMNSISNSDAIISKKTNGLWLYNSSTNQVTYNYETGRNWRYVFEMPTGDALIGGSLGSSGLLLYDVETKEIEQIYSSGYGYDTFVTDENGVIITASVYSDDTLYYDYSLGTCTKVA